MRVYVAGPITLGPLEQNIRNAMDAARVLMENGFEPFVPHLWCFFQIVYPQEYKRWIKLDNAYLDVCQALLRIPGESRGSDEEVRYARAAGIPVFTNIVDLINWRHDNQKVRELASDVPRVESTS